MAYSALPTKAAGDILDLTTYLAIKANFEAGVPDIMTTKGDLPVATLGDEAARLGVGSNDSIVVADSTAATGLAWQDVPACRIYNNADITPAVGSWHTLSFSAERFDPNGMHTVGGTNIVIPAGGAGIYKVGSHVTFGTGGYATGEAIYGTRIILTATTTVIDQDYECKNYQSIEFDSSLCTLYSLAVGDSIALQVYVPVAVNVLYRSAYSPEFWAVWQRRQ